LLLIRRAGWPAPSGPPHLVLPRCRPVARLMSAGIIRAVHELCGAVAAQRWTQGPSSSVITVGELRRGIESIRPHDPTVARALERWLRRVLRDHSDRLGPPERAGSAPGGKRDSCGYGQGSRLDPHHAQREGRRPFGDPSAQPVRTAPVGDLCDARAYSYSVLRDLSDLYSRSSRARDRQAPVRTVRQDRCPSEIRVRLCPFTTSL
jgi:hypothetical protein